MNEAIIDLIDAAIYCLSLCKPSNGSHKTELHNASYCRAAMRNVQMAVCYAGYES